MAHFFQIISMLVILSMFATLDGFVVSNLTAPIVHQNEQLVINKVFTCVDDTSCNGHGKCINNTVCQCDPGWITIQDVNGVDQGACSYKQLKKKTAFLISLFLGYFGGDWFYLAQASTLYIIVGIVKLAVDILGCVLSLAAKYRTSASGNESLSFTMSTTITFINLLSLAWWIVDWARILSDKFPDGRGNSLMPW